MFFKIFQLIFVIASSVVIVFIYFRSKNKIKKYWDINTQEDGLFSGNPDDTLNVNEAKIFQKDMKKIVINPLNFVVVLVIINIIISILGYILKFYS